MERINKQDFLSSLGSIENVDNLKKFLSFVINEKIQEERKKLALIDFLDKKEHIKSMCNIEVLKKYLHFAQHENFNGFQAFVDHIKYWTECIKERKQRYFEDQTLYNTRKEYLIMTDEFRILYQDKLVEFLEREYVNLNNFQTNTILILRISAHNKTLQRIETFFTVFS